jgi:hypothetical protein
MSMNDLRKRPIARGCLTVAGLALVVALLLALALFAVGWKFEQNLKAQRKRVLDRFASAAAQNELRDWCRSRMSSATTSIRWREMPRFLTDAGVTEIQRVTDDQHRVVAIRLDFGGADNSFGLLVADSADPPREFFLPVRKTIASGIWFYDELKLRY